MRGLGLGLGFRVRVRVRALTLTFDQILKSFDRLVTLGSRIGYYSEPSKRILVVRKEKMGESKEVFSDQGFKIQNSA